MIGAGELEAFVVAAPIAADAEVGPPPRKRILLSRRQLARALGKNLNVLNRWHDAGMPYVSAGAGGRGYEYDVDEVKAWRAQVEEDERRRRAETEEEVQRHLALEGGEGRDELVDLTLEQRSKHYDNERRRLALSAQRRDLVEARDMRREFEETFAYIADRLQSLPDLLERRIQLSPKGVAVVLEVVDDFQDRLADALEDVEASFQHERGDRDASRAA